jgi:hypothetical protein
VPDDLADHDVGQIPALIGVNDRGDAIEEFKCLPMVSCELIDDVGVGALLRHVSS